MAAEYSEAILKYGHDLAAKMMATNYLTHKDKAEQTERGEHERCKHL
jgi:hypothetical protein